jgi:predicted enzyme related to lactoylglutathione lyase
MKFSYAAAFGWSFTDYGSTYATFNDDLGRLSRQSWAPAAGRDAHFRISRRLRLQLYGSRRRGL